MSWRSILPWLAFQGVWLVCAFGAARGNSAVGIVSALVFVAAVITWSRQRMRDLLLVAVSGTCGFLVESGLVMSGHIRFAAPWPTEQLAPAWIVALWMAFGATVPAISDKLGAHRLKIAAALGAVAGPLAYLAGARLGALNLLGAATSSFVVLSALWAAVMAGLVELHAWTRE